MPDDKAIKIENHEDFTEDYANNVFFESSVWDLKILFGNLDQSSSEVLVIRRHTAISIPWLQARLMSYFLHLNVSIHEHSNGSEPMPKRLLPPPPTPPIGELANDPTALAAYEDYLQIYKQHFPDQNI